MFLSFVAKKDKKQEAKQVKAMTQEDAETIDISPTKKKELFTADEVIHGKCLGHGGFADVYEVRSFRPHHEQDQTRSMSSVDLRQFFEEHAKDESGECKYAIKCLHPELQQEGQQKLFAAENDIASEAALLATVDHPNIVKVYGYAGDEHPDGKTGPLNSYFLIMDKLAGTLDDRIARWKWQKHRQMITPVLHLLDHNFHANMKKELLVERLQVAYEIALAMAYLHDERIVYRDLKPSNVGFDADGHCKLFDFGLSRKLPEEKCKLRDDTFVMSGKVGSCPYMGPEIWKKQPYNEKVDVYSFAIILWEILALEKAFIDYAYDKAALAEHVFIKGDRPPIKHCWPVELQELLPKAWSQDMNDRPSMQNISIILKETVARLKGGDYAGLHPKRRESRHILTGVKRLLHRDTRNPVTTSN